MRVLRNLFVEHLAMDLGSVNTRIFIPGRGVVLSEPSVVALDKYSREVQSVGHTALKHLGRAPRDLEIYRPIRCGAIDNFEVAEKMLKAFLKPLRDGYRRSHLLIGVPGSATTIEQRSLREAVHDARGGRVDLVDEGLAAALGAGLELKDEQAQLVVDIGGGTVKIAIIGSGGGIISSVSFPVAGNAMDESIRDYVRSRHAIQIGEITAERVKRHLGTVSDKTPATNQRLEVVGKDLSNGMPAAVEITAAEVRGALQPVLSEIVERISKVIEEAPPEVTADIYHLGLMLTGGGSLLRGLQERLQTDLHLRVVLADDPLAAVALGAGSLLEAPDRLNRATIRTEIAVWEASPELVVNW